MESETKSRGWWVAGIVSAIALSVIVFGGSEPIAQPANVVSAPVIAETHTAPSISPEVSEAISNEKYEDVSKPTPTSNSLSNDNYYTNVDGNSVHSPAYSDGGIPAGASARCRDGTYSFSQNRRGTCSHHGGVATWY